MIRTILIASVAALAITAPAQAQRGGNKDDREAARAEAQAQRAKAKGDGEQRGQARAQRVEAPQRQQRVQMEQPQRQQRVQMERPQRQQRVQMEQPQRQQRVQMERPQRQQRVQMERLQREQRVRQQQPRVERVARAQNRAVERRAINNRQVRTMETRGRPSIQRQQADNRLNRQQLQQQDRQVQRFAGQQDRQAQRIDQRDALASQRALRADLRDQRRIRPQASVGERLNLRQQQVNQDWYNNYAEQRGRTFYNSSPDFYYDYNYNDGYLYQVNRNNNLVTGLFPLLGGAFGVGRPLPIGYDSYNVPYGYRSLYYDTPDYYYRYGDGGIYRVDRDTQLIQAVAALLTGQSLGIGQRLPLGYDVYNVPYGYRDQYYDTNSMWYRYDDGTIYGVDPYSRMIQSAYPVSYGYNVGYPVPAYANYGGYGGFNDYGYGGYGGYGGYDAGYGGYSGYGGYGVPYGYRDLYYGAPGYNYQYANGGIYQVDPSTQLVSALVALVTGTNLGVGQVLPMGYDAYNVPYQYRSSYYDTPDAWYRYDDGNIYQVDPRTRIIQSSIPVSYNGYAVGYPMPAYAGYAVPSSYSDLYYAQPGYDYRYLNGGIYQVDPNTRMVQGVAALLTGTNLGVGQRLPMGYDVYNVPIAYRGTYHDTPDAWYRYNDGYIYRVDPQTRVIRARIDGIA